MLKRNACREGNVVHTERGTMKKGHLNALTPVSVRVKSASRRVTPYCNTMVAFAQSNGSTFSLSPFKFTKIRTHWQSRVYRRAVNDILAYSCLLPPGTYGSVAAL